MSQQSAQKSALGKWAFKNWYPVYSPTIFNEVPVGEAPAEEASKLLNRTIGVTLFDITKDLSHLTIKLTFQIDRVEGDRAFTRFKEMELARDYIRSLVRRGSSKVMAIQDVTTSDGAVLRFEVLAVTTYRCSTSRKRGIRAAISSKLSEITANADFATLVRDTAMGKLSISLMDAGRKVYPLRKAEVMKLKVIRYPTRPSETKKAEIAVPQPTQ
ncbi:MAG: 30S ribosomal protein S3Ae [Thermocladium sp. ECH_B]|nr:MAG: 30S ribosomal protein S3Ae [Thermocladium sp. ECH_B]